MLRLFAYLHFHEPPVDALGPPKPCQPDAYRGGGIFSGSVHRTVEPVSGGSNIPDQSTDGDTARIRYIGDASCGRCHGGIAASHRNTAHWHTSAAPADSTIRGSFAAGANRFPYTDSVYIRMEKRRQGFYQTLYSNDEEAISERFAVVMGSGTKGQTYLYWADDNKLFQLPISYFTPAQTWANSPGYPGLPIFTRPVPGRCLECHATSATQTNPFGDGQPSFDRDRLLLGIGCERCHGPAGDHVAWHDAHPADTVSHGLPFLKNFTRQQKLDLCRFCHGGNMPLLQQSFTNMPGEPLAAFFAVNSTAHRKAGIDVHGNQYGLLAESRCFRNSAMTCNSCHDTHRTERDQVLLFSGRCQTCHQAGHDPVCALTGKVDGSTLLNCIDCHMPRQPSQAITMYLPGQHTTTPALMRSHRIAVYPGETDRILAGAAGGKPVRLQAVFDAGSGRWHYR